MFLIFASNRKDVNLDYNQIIDSRTDGLSIDRVMKFKFYFFGMRDGMLIALRQSQIQMYLFV
ncbi:MAG: hypothetical protein L6U99_07050 [Clostridium sp.]|nr:MAG: hypothetical protein L6U99_07050 [Clostridium sp.]